MVAPSAEGPMTHDVSVTGDGTVFLFHIHSDAAREFVAEHVSEDRQLFGGAVAVEHRFASNLIHGMRDAGLVVAVKSATKWWGEEN
jgi:hypothetical protein